MLEVQALAL